MKKEQLKKITKRAAVGSLTVAGKLVFGMFQFFDDLEFMRSHQSLCLSMGVEQARAYLAETEEYWREYRRSRSRLKKRGWIKERKIGDQMMAVLTESGEAAAIEIALQQLVPDLPNGEYWMVVFDFPEVAHKARDDFRNMLKRIGFVYHQKSIWCSKKDVGKGMKRMIDILHIGKWVRIYRAIEYK